MSIWIFFRLIGALALLMFGMKTMSDSLQKMAGPQLRHVLGTMTTNRLTGILSGTLITAAVQSSTATTVMTVSFVNAGLLTLAQAISVIMGANIGTTLTAWIMSAGFSFNITDFVWLAFFIAIILIYSKKRKIIGDFIFGISFMFLGLGTLRQTGIDMDLAHNQPVLEFFSSFDPHSFQTTITFLIIGSILTMCVQSSAAVMAITMILCSTGVLPIYQGIALVMGENIGTTVTSNVAALTANTQARRAAMAHMVFNIFGVLWILCVFRPFIHLVCGWVGFDDAMEKSDPHFVANAAKLSFVLAAFHTTFNLSNTFILVWFIPQIEKLVCKIIRPKKNADEDDFRLRFIQSGIMKTPEISVLEAQKEIHCFAERIQRMFGMVKELLGETNDDKFIKLYTRIEKYEGISDNMEIEIAKYLDQVSDSHLSDETKAKIRAMLREISEIESIGDSCFNIARTLNRRIRGKEDFIPSQYEHMHQMMELTDNALTQMNITLVGHKVDNDANLSFNIENEINNYRNQLKSQNINDVNNHLYTYAIGTMYMDIIQECEKLGDYVVNVVEARMGVRQHEA
ncbi:MULTISPECIES: Na/Pi cotransporter family protein [Prevotellaceae]|jgi:phosphate:Na+ symporter|uniref:Na/Pi cotransporter family protein n=1 Tax=Prevotellaceae TaxID=171552 RepID=UPI000E444CCB|nr:MULTISPECIES: Na/Pi cotransporter family protein [Prevotellaceae]MBW0025012.1 Na/Pi cotransporter family protein [Segatella copri]MEE1391967.1 Na/Pi cotransporter family protein [Segatella copri]RGK30580.1 Na/Pi cotransporter family protein [Prevotella sp. TF12-30]RHN98380.1 Na/Pi cotransporter family protein [Prevotella sp. AM23-5]